MNGRMDGRTGGRTDGRHRRTGEFGRGQPDWEHQTQTCPNIPPLRRLVRFRGVCQRPRHSHTRRGANPCFASSVGPGRSPRSVLAKQQEGSRASMRSTGRAPDRRRPSAGFHPLALSWDRGALCPRLLKGAKELADGIKCWCIDLTSEHWLSNF